MTKKTRVILFLSCFFAFFLITLPVIFYAQGYRFDFTTKKVVQTGGIFLKVDPKQARVFIEGEPEEKTDFLFGTVLVKNLLPGKYKVRIVKDGFHPWEKTLEVREKEVAEAKNIFLTPENPRLEILSKNIENFWFPPDGEKLIFLRNDEEGGRLISYSLNDGSERRLLEEKNISKDAKIFDLKFLPNQRDVLLETKIKNETKYLILDLTKTDPLPRAATSSATTSFPLPQKINNAVYELDNSGYLLKNGQKLTDEPFKDFKVSPDLQKMVLVNDYEIWVLFLAPQSAAPQRKEFEKIHLTRFSRKIGGIFWYNPHYLIFNVGEEVKVAEIDNRDRLNVVDLTSFKNAEAAEIKIFFDEINQKLYILNKNNLFVSERLLP